MVRRYPKRDSIRLLVAALLSGAALAAVPAPSAQAAPVVTITKPLPGTVTNETTPSFVGTEEEGAGAVTLNVYSGLLPEGEALQTLSTAIFAAGVWALGPLEALPDGVYTAQASQGAGKSLPVTFTILTLAPHVTIDRPQPAAGERAPAFTGTASETTPVTVQIHAGETTEGTLVAIASAAGTGAGWHSSPANPALAFGRYTAVAIQASSLVGNPAGRSEPVSFDVVPVPPAPPSAGPAGTGAVAHAETARPSSSGPALMAPFPVVRFTGVSFAAGLRLRLLSVGQAPAGALVRVRCRGHGCPRHGARRTTVAGKHGVPVLAFRSFQRFLRAGAVVEVLVSKPGEIGKYTRLRVRRGRLPERTDLCLDAAGVKPIACPAG